MGFDYFYVFFVPFRMKQACSLISEDYKPPFTFVVVQKRINARFYLKKGPQAENPAPGSVLDHTITRRGMYDFYLVPQSVRQGTVTPTHCVVLEDETGMQPDHLQVNISLLISAKPDHLQ